jgi:hypothetical protein
VDPADFTLATVPERFARLGDPSAGAAGSLDSLLELAARQAASGMPDAPWPPHYEKTADEPPRVMPSRRRMTMPLIEIGRAAAQEEALAGLARWKERHPGVWEYLQPADVLVDSMRGRFTTWTRIRVNLRNVPPELCPAQEPLDPDYSPWYDGARQDPDGT